MAVGNQLSTVDSAKAALERVKAGITSSVAIPRLMPGLRDKGELARLLALGYDPAILAAGFDCDQESIIAYWDSPEGKKAIQEWRDKPKEALEPELIRMLPLCCETLYHLAEKGAADQWGRARMNAVELVFRSVGVVESEKAGSGGGPKAAAQLIVNYISSDRKAPEVIDAVAREITSEETKPDN